MPQLRILFAGNDPDVLDTRTKFLENEGFFLIKTYEYGNMHMKEISLKYENTKDYIQKNPKTVKNIISFLYKDMKKVLAKRSLTK